MKTKFALPRKLLSSILAVVLLAVAIFPCAVSAAATEYNAGVAVSQADEYKTQWRFIPVGEDTYIFDKPVTAKVYRLQSTKSGLYLTYAGADADGKNVTLKTAPLDENNQGQLWSFILNWNTAGTGYNLLTKATGYGDYDFGACIYYDGSSSTNMRLSGALYWDASGEATIMLNSNGSTTVESLAGADGSFIATIQYRWPDPYLNEDYIPVDNGIDDPTVEPETPVSYGDVEFTSLNAGTKWTFTPAKKATAVFWAAGGEKEETFYSISVGDAFLTANYDENGVFTGLSMESRNKSNDGQHWCLDPFWINGNNFGLCNLGGTVNGVIAQLTYRDGTFGMMSNVWTGEAGLAVKLDPRANDTNLYPLITNENGIGTAYICVGNGSTYLKLTALCDENRYNDTATAETKQVFGQAANYDVTEIDATEYTFNPIGTADCYNVDGTEVPKVFSGNGFSTGNGVVYTISNGDKFLTANFGDNESVTLTFETRDQSNKNQQWMLYNMWGGNQYYGLVSLGYTNEYETAGKEVACMVKSNGNGFAVSTIMESSIDGIFINNSNTVQVSIADLIKANGKFDGSFVANFGMANQSSFKTLELDVFSATETVKIVSNRAEVFEGEKTVNNVAYLWKLTAVEKNDVTYYTMQNKLTGLYLTMHLGTVYLAERDEANNHQLWKFVDCAADYGVAEGIYEIQCYTTSNAINTIYSGGYDATVDLGEDDISFSYVLNGGGAGGRAWTLSYNRTPQVVGDGMICVINSFQWEDTANWENNGTNYYLAAKDEAVSGKIAKYGDVNADDNVDICDLIAMKNLSLSEGEITQRANLNPATQDRGATAVDLVTLKKLIFDIL